MDIYSLEQILSQNLSWNGARIKFPARFLVALFQVQTVNLTKIALGTVQNDDDKLNLVYDYGTTQNNGNVLSESVKIFVYLFINPYPNKERY